MSAYKTQLPAPLRELLREGGYDPNAEIVPSANGGPIPTDKSGEMFLRDVQSNFGELYRSVQEKVAPRPKRAAASTTRSSKSDGPKVRWTATDHSA